MAKIEKMTAAQQADMLAYFAEWMANGISTARSDPVEMRRVVGALVGDNRPVIVMDSPLGCLVARALVGGGKNPEANLGANLGDNLRANLRANLGDNLRANLGANLGDNLGANLGDNLRDNLGANLGDNLRANLRDNLRANLWDNLGANLGDNLRANLGDNLWANLRDNLRANLWDNLGDNLRANLWDNLGDNLGAIHENPSLWGGMDTGWLAFYDFPRQLGHKYPAELSARLDNTLAYAKSCGVLYAYSKAAFVSQRPSLLKRDAAGRLHNIDGMAMAFADGYGFHAWRGVRVPAAIIENRRTFAAKEVLVISNAEHRRCAIEIYAETHGPERFVRDLGATLLSEDKSHRRPRRLYRLGDMQFVHVVNGSLEADGSRREFMLGAETTVKTPAAAIAASYGRPASKYREAVRT